MQTRYMMVFGRDDMGDTGDRQLIGECGHDTTGRMSAYITALPR